MRHFVVSVLACFICAPTVFADTQNCNGNSSCETDIDEYYESTDNHGGESHASSQANGGAGGSAAAFGGSSEQGQLQSQGQIGVNTSRNSVKTDVDTTDLNTNLNTNKGLNLQGQTSVGEVDSHDSILVEGDTFEATEMPVNTAAPVFAGSCAQGMSLQLGQTGASVGSGNPVCDLATVAGLYIAAGDRDSALKVAAEAHKVASRRAMFSFVRSFLTFGLF